jgi:phosphonopyruvate decarboxylase
MIETKGFYDYLQTKQLDMYMGVPDSLLKNICACIKENCCTKKNIITANEGNAVAMACGYHIATGKYGVVYMQNSGQGNTVNPLLSLADEDVYKIPMLLLIGWRGEPGIKDEPQHKKQGKVTLSLLDTMGIEYIILEDNYKNQIDYCYEYMKKYNKPIALIVRKGLFSDYKVSKKISRYTLTREEALKIILKMLDDEEFIVSTTGKTSREIFELREAGGQGHANDFLTVGSMGHTASIAFGMTLGTDKNIYCIDGDGSFLMHAGGFGVIAQNAQNNFKYILINNGAHESVGGQPTVAFDIDIQTILKGFGFTNVYKATEKDEIKDAMRMLKTKQKSALIIYTKQGSRSDLGRPTTTPQENKIAMMEKLSK